VILRHCSYGRVCRKKFRQRLLEKCKTAGVQFLGGEVANISCHDGAAASEVTLVDGRQLKTRFHPLPQVSYPTHFQGPRTAQLTR